MPKDRKARASPSHRSKCYSFKPYSNHGKGLAVAQGDSSMEEDLIATKDWEAATCPICMDFPHNAVLLLCNSHDKGCRPFMCDTSYRHSNCFDQYRKAHLEAQKASTAVETLDARITPWTGALESDGSTRTVRRMGMRSSGAFGSENGTFLVNGGVFEDPGGRGGSEMSPGRARRLSSPEKQNPPDLICPLCRGSVTGWRVVEAARKFLNKKTRSCSQEACSFAGTYEELRAHARCEHPSARPSEIDPARQHDWRRLERQRDLGDVLSTIRSAMPGATFFGDYVIEGNDDDNENENDESDFPGDEGHWWTVFLLFQVLGPATSISGGRLIPSRVRGLARDHYRSSGMRHGLWGEHLNSNGSSGTEGNNFTGSSDTGEQSMGSSRRRRRSQD